MQITAAALLERMATNPASACRLAGTIPAILMLLAAPDPEWLPLLRARLSVAVGLIHIIHALDAATLAGTKPPEARDAALAPLMCSTAAHVLLRAQRRGPVRLTTAAATALAEAAACKDWDMSFLGTDGLQAGVHARALLPRGSCQGVLVVDVHSMLPNESPLQDRAYIEWQQGPWATRQPARATIQPLHASTAVDSVGVGG